MVSVASAVRAALPSSLGSRSMARARISLAVPLAMRSFVHCSNFTGDTTDTMESSFDRVASTSSICATLPGVNRSTRFWPSGTVNSTTMFSPPNSSW